MKTELILHQLETATPLGTIYFVTRDDTLAALDFGAVDGRLTRLLDRRFKEGVKLSPARTDHRVGDALKAYLSGELSALATVESDGGGTGFQKKVWDVLRTIPPGQTWSYGEIAVKLGSANAARAVGLANSLNPINLFVPCHRVIGKDGALTGYGGGMERKRWLLAHELGAEATLAGEQLALFEPLPRLRTDQQI